MKRKFLQILITLAGICVTANFATAQGWGVGVSGGIGFAFGDISTSEFSDAKYHLGFSVKKELFSYFDLKANAILGALEGRKAEYESGTPAGLRFRSDYITYNAMLKFRLTDFIVDNDEAKFSMYLQAGAGMLHFKSVQYNSIRNSRIESGTTTDITVPLGIGFEYRFTPAFSAALDFTGHVTSATKLDVVENSFFRDMMFTPSIGINYVFGKSSSSKVPQQTYQQIPPVQEVPVVEPIEEEVPVVEPIEEEVIVVEAIEDDADVIIVEEDIEITPVTTPATNDIGKEDDFDFDFEDITPAAQPATQQVAPQTSPQTYAESPTSTEIQSDVIVVRAETVPSALTTREGLVYRVQIAAVQQYNAGMAMSLKNKYALSQVPFEEIEGGLYKYTIGTNRSLEEAMAFKETLIAKGITDAFIVPYYVGKRISNQEARALLQQ